MENNNETAVVDKPEENEMTQKSFKALSAEDYKQLSQVDRIKYRQNKAAEDLRAYTIKHKFSSKKDDDRRKILIGALVQHTIKEPASNAGIALLSAVRNGALTNDAIKECMDEYLKRNVDRILFGLAPLPEDPNNLSSTRLCLIRNSLFKPFLSKNPKPCILNKLAY